MTREEPCRYGEHLLNQSRITGEWLGPCAVCGMSLDAIEAQEEEGEELEALLPPAEPTVDQAANLLIDEVGAVLDTHEQIQALIFAQAVLVEDFGLVVS